jgi:hypothetical protein
MNVEEIVASPGEHMEWFDNNLFKFTVLYLFKDEHEEVNMVTGETTYTALPVDEETGMCVYFDDFGDKEQADLLQYLYLKAYLGRDKKFPQYYILGPNVNVKAIVEKLNSAEEDEEDAN